MFLHLFNVFLTNLVLAASDSSGPDFKNAQKPEYRYINEKQDGKRGQIAKYLFY